MIDKTLTVQEALEADLASLLTLIAAIEADRDSLIEDSSAYSMEYKNADRNYVARLRQLYNELVGNADSGMLGSLIRAKDELEDLVNA